MTASENLWNITSLDCLIEWANQLGVEAEDRHAWAILDECMDRDPIDCNSGPTEEYLRMAARMAVRNADPSYRGYTPFGEI